MKELSIKEKAKRFDKVIEKLRSLHDDYDTVSTLIDIKEELENILPELKESEDEKIRKELIEQVAYIIPNDDEVDSEGNTLPTYQKRIDKYCVWLEKQGEQMSDPRYSILNKLIEADDIYQMSVNDTMVEEAKNKAIETLSKLEISKLLGLEKQGGITKLSEEEQNRFAKGVLSNCAMSFIDYLDAHNCEGKMCVSNGDCADIENAFHNGMWDKLHRYYCKYIEKQNEQNHANSTKTYKIEQNPADKVEPKFHKGEWVIFNEHHNSVYQVEKIQGLRYYLRHYLGGTLSIRFDSELIRKWTLQDAKSGDVLASNCSIFIFSQEYMAGKPEAHCGIMNGFFIAKPEGCWTNEKIYPATKEQRYALFAKMREAGYEWDAEKKELKKIEQNPAWSEEDAEMVEGLNNCLDELEEENGWKYVYVKDKNVELTEIRNWMKALKDRVMPQPKQEWSEEDEDMLDNIIDDYDDADEHNLVDDIGKVMWLKSLKSRIQPNKEWNEKDLYMQKQAIECINNSGKLVASTKEIEDWLNSLKDRYIWKPTELQIQCLHDAIEHYHTNGYPATKLTELYEQMSKIYNL